MLWWKLLIKWLKMYLTLKSPFPQPWFLKPSWRLWCWRGVSSLHMAEISHWNRFWHLANINGGQIMRFAFQAPTENVFPPQSSLVTLTSLLRRRYDEACGYSSESDISTRFSLHFNWMWVDWQSAMVDCDFDCPLIAAAAAIGNRCTFSALIGAKLPSNQLAALGDNLQYLDSLNGDKKACFLGW